MKLHRMLLTMCMRCPRMYPPLMGHLNSTRLLTSVGPLSYMGENEALSPMVGRAMRYCTRLSVPPMYNSDDAPEVLCCHLLLKSRRSPIWLTRNKVLLRGGASWAGKKKNGPRIKCVPHILYSCMVLPKGSHTSTIMLLYNYYLAIRMLLIQYLLSLKI